MRRWIPASLMVVALATTVILAASPDPTPGRPQYTGDNQLLRPADYREWIFLSSGLGMSYSAQADHQMFTNVMVPRWAYQEFLKSGRWPDKTMFVVEERGATSKGSINKAGHYQTDLMGIGVEVKDETHFADKWAYFNFDEGSKTASANPKAGCWSCHDQHAAVEHVFVQFYPTLKPVAKKFGTYREAAENVQ
jgi:hypothetical protein